LIIKINKYHYRIYFSNASSLDTTDAELKQIVTLLHENKGQVGQLTGHVAHANDKAKVEQCKKELALLRSYLERQGIPTTSLFSQFVGDKIPYASNSTSEGNKLNERIEFFLNIRNLNE
jgi:hypothetical protein